MLRLKCFGGLTLECTTGPLSPAAVQRRRLALLALLAVAGEREMSRDKLAAYLWPENDTEHARASLAQAIYMLRRELHADDLFVGASSVRLNPAVVTSDVQEFAQAIASRQFESAVELYKGPFLDGIYLSDAPEFERWAEEERERLSRRHLAALDALATDATDRGAHAEAVEWCRRAAESSPTDSRLATRLVTALTCVGDRAGALQHARAHESLLREELEVTPDAEFFAAVERALAPVTPASRPPLPTEGPPDSLANLLNSSAPLTSDPPPKRNPHAVLVRRLFTSTLIVALTVGGLTFLSALRTRTASTPHVEATSRRLVVAVIPFAVDSGSSFAYLREGIPKLLGASLDGAGPIRSADERAVLSAAGSVAAARFGPVEGDSVARRLGAQLFVLGDVFQSHDRLRIVATMYERPDLATPVARRSVEGDTGHVFELVDELARELIGSRFRQPVDRLTAVASVTTHSLPAFRLYLEGEERMRAYQYPAAVSAFRRAVAIDTTFALAFHRLSEAADWTGNPKLVDSAARRAVAHSSRLTERDRLFLEGMLAWRSGETDQSEMVLEKIVNHYPLDVDSWYHLGEVRFHSSPLRGRPLAAAIIPFERTLALEQNHRGALIHLMRVYAHAGRFVESDRLGERLALVEESLFPNGYTVIATGSDSAREALAAAFATKPAGSLWDFANRGAVFTGNAREANRYARMFASRALSPSDLALAHVAIAETEAAQGRFRVAEQMLASSSLIPPSAFLGVRAALALLPFADRSHGRAEMMQLRDSLTTWKGFAVRNERIVAVPLDALDSSYRAYPLGLLNARLKDSTAARRFASELANPQLMAYSRSLTRALARSVSAEIARASGDRERALRLLVDSQPPVPLELQVTFYGVSAYERWARAELLRELGRTDEALGWYNSLAVTSIHEIAYLAPSHLRQAQIHEQRGDRTRSAYHYARFAEMWSRCDPELRPMVDDARLRAASFLRGSKR